MAQVGNTEVDHSYVFRAELDDVTPRKDGSGDKKGMFYTLLPEAPGADLLFNAAAAYAAGAMALQAAGGSNALADRATNKAKELFTMAGNAPGIYSQSIPEAAKTYNSDNWEQYGFFAAAWLLRLTGEANYEQVCVVAPRDLMEIERVTWFTLERSTESFILDCLVSSNCLCWSWRVAHCTSLGIFYSKSICLHCNACTANSGSTPAGTHGYAALTGTVSNNTNVECRWLSSTWSKRTLSRSTPTTAGLPSTSVQLQSCGNTSLTRARTVLRTRPSSRTLQICK